MTEQKNTQMKQPLEAEIGGLRLRPPPLALTRLTSSPRPAALRGPTPGVPAPKMAVSAAPAPSPNDNPFPPSPDFFITQPEATP
jgi:hypothetical protein